MQHSVNRIGFYLRNPKFLRATNAWEAFEGRVRHHLNRPFPSVSGISGNPANRAVGRIISQADCVGFFNSLRMRPNVFLHAGLRSFNSFESDTTLRSALVEYGVEHLAMPYFAANKYQTDYEDLKFDDAISNMGSLAGRFCIEDGVWRSVHPTHSTLCKGPYAQWIVRAHSNSIAACDRCSPFFRAALLDFDALLLGVNLNRLTAVHICEDILLPDQLILPLYERRKFKAVLHSRQIRYVVETYVRQVSYKIRQVERLRPALIESGAMRIAKSDFFELAVVNFRGLTRTLYDQWAAGFTMYGHVWLTKRERHLIKTARENFDNDMAMFDANPKQWMNTQ